MPSCIPDCSMPSRSSTDWKTILFVIFVLPSTSSSVAVLKLHVSRHSFPFEGLDEPLGRHDVVIDAVERELVAFGVALDYSPATAPPPLHLLDDGC